MTSEGVFRTANGGRHWERTLPSSYPGPVCIVGSTTFTCNVSDGLLVSSDSGRTWKPVETTVPVTTDPLFLKAKGPNLVTVLPGEGVFFITDNGLFNKSTVSALASNGSTLFAFIQDRGIVLSTDNGHSWTQATAGLPSELLVCSFLTYNHLVIAGARQGSISAATVE